MTTKDAGKNESHGHKTAASEAHTPKPTVKATALSDEDSRRAYELLREFRRHKEVGEFMSNSTHPLVAPDGTEITRVLTHADLPEIKRVLAPFSADSRVAALLAWE